MKGIGPKSEILLNTFRLKGEDADIAQVAGSVEHEMTNTSVKRQCTRLKNLGLLAPGRIYIGGGHRLHLSKRGEQLLTQIQSS